MSTKPAHLLTLSEYQQQVTPLIQAYNKFVKKNEAYLVKADYSGLQYYTFADLINAYNSGIKKKSEYEKNLTDEQAAQKQWNYQKNHTFDNWQATPVSGAPDSVAAENKAHLDKLLQYFSEKELRSQIDKDEVKNNKRSVKRALDNNTYKKLLEEDKLTLDELKTITDSVGVKITKNALDIRSKQSELYAKLYAELPNANREVLIKLGKDLLASFEPIEQKIRERETDRYHKLIAKLVLLPEINVVDLHEQLSFYNSVFNYEIERRLLPDKKQQDAFAKELSLKTGWEKVVANEIEEYIKLLEAKFMRSVYDNFTKITLPITSFTLEDIYIDVKGFQGTIVFDFNNGSRFAFVTEAISAGGWNIQEFHYRYIHHFKDIVLPTGEVEGEKPLHFIIEHFSDGGKGEEVFNPYVTTQKATTIEELALPLYRWLRNQPKHEISNVRLNEGKQDISISFKRYENHRMKPSGIWLKRDIPLEQNKEKVLLMLKTIGAKQPDGAEQMEKGGVIKKRVPKDLDTDLGIRFGQKIKNTGEIIVAHSTSSNLLPKIFKEGLKSGSERVWENSSSGKLFFEIEPTSSYYGNNVYGWKSVQKYGGVEVTLYVKVKQNELRIDKDDSHLGVKYRKNQMECTCDVPPENIIGLRFVGLDIKRADFIEFYKMFADDTNGNPKMEQGGKVAEHEELINGFYSPLEKIIREAKLDKMPVKQWQEKFARGEEAKWTGLTEWLSEQAGSISKSDILRYLKENRIEIVEKEIEQEPYKDELIRAQVDFDALMNKVNILVDKYPYETRPSAIQSEISVLGNKLNAYNDKYAGIYDFAAKKYIEGSELTKYHQYQLAGDKQYYKEVLVIMPFVYEKEIAPLRKLYEAGKITDVEFNNKAVAIKDKYGIQDVFRSSHFDEPNILIHLRISIRIDAKGNKVLFIEEIQSDWSQKGRREGFVPEKINTDKGFIDYRDSLFKKYNVDGLTSLRAVATKEEMAIFETLFSNENDVPNQLVPNAPFVTDTNAWVKLGLKVALKQAIKQGAAKIAWTTGEQQNDRYDLSKHINSIHHTKNIDGTYDIMAYDKNDKTVIEKLDVPENELDSIVGKDVAKKIIAREGVRNISASQQEIIDRGKAVSSFHKEDGKMTLEGWYVRFESGKEMGTWPSKETVDKFINQINEQYFGTHDIIDRVLSGVDLRVGGKGMIGFYGSIKENKLGIIGEVAKKVFGQTPQIVEIEVENVNPVKSASQEITVENTHIVKQGNSYKLKNKDGVTLADVSQETRNNYYNEEDFHEEVVRMAIKYPIDFSKTLSPQYGVLVTAELKSEVDKGLPLFREGGSVTTSLQPIESDAIYNRLKLIRFSEEANRANTKQFLAKDGSMYYIKKNINEPIFKVYDKDLKQVGVAVFDDSKAYGKDGYITGYTHNQSIEIEPEYRRKGIATAITDFAELFYEVPYKPTNLLSPEMQGFVANRNAGKMENGGATDFGKAMSASSRFRPMETVVFTKPVVGVNGNKLVSYQWSYEWTELPNHEGELVAKRVSDWTQAELSADTGKDLVHKFTVLRTDGEYVTVSSESVPVLLGYTTRAEMKNLPSLVSAVKTLSKQRMQLAILEAQEKENRQLEEKFTKAPKPEIKEIEEPINLAHLKQQNKEGKFNVYAMGDVWRRQDNRYEYDSKSEKTIYFKANSPNKETVEQLQYSWIKNRIEENGGKYPSGIYDLRRRVERQERKVQQITAAEESGKIMEQGGEITLSDLEFDELYKKYQRAIPNDSIYGVFTHNGITFSKVYALETPVKLPDGKQAWAHTNGLNRIVIMKGLDYSNFKKAVLHELEHINKKDNPDFLEEYPEFTSQPKYKQGGAIDNNKELYARWKKLVNMSYSELKKFYDSEEGKEAGLSKEQADKLDIGSGRESARWIMKMKQKPQTQWTPTMWDWAKRQVGFISRMRGNKGSLYDEKGNKTPKHLSLLIWGHNPEKMKFGGDVSAVTEFKPFTPENIQQALQSMDLVNLAEQHHVGLGVIQEQFSKGLEVEREHTDNLLIASEIVKDHLAESPYYYTLLEEMEGKFANGGETDQQLSVAEINKRIKKSRNAAYKLLVNKHDCGAFDGGCLIYAQALQKAFGGEVVVLQSDIGVAGHAVLKLGDIYFDADGGLPAKEFINSFNKKEEAESVSIRKMKPSDMPETPRDEKMSIQIAELLTGKKMEQGGTIGVKSLLDIANHHKVPIAQIKEAFIAGTKKETEPNSIKRAAIIKKNLMENPDYYSAEKVIEKIGAKDMSLSDYEQLRKKQEKLLDHARWMSYQYDTAEKAIAEGASQKDLDKWQEYSDFIEKYDTFLTHEHAIRHALAQKQMVSKAAFADQPSIVAQLKKEYESGSLDKQIEKGIVSREYINQILDNAGLGSIIQQDKSDVISNSSDSALDLQGNEKEEEIFQYLNKWIDLEDKATLQWIDIRDTNWYPTKHFIRYAKDKNFSYGSSEPDLYDKIKSGKIVWPVIVEKTMLNDIDSDFKLLDTKKKGYSVRDGVHRIAIQEDLGMYKIPALVYEKSDDKLTRDFSDSFKTKQEFEKWAGSISELYKNKPKENMKHDVVDHEKYNAALQKIQNFMLLLKGEQLPTEEPVQEEIPVEREQLPENEQRFYNAVYQVFKSGAYQLDNRKLDAFADKFELKDKAGSINKALVKELTELAIANHSRELAHENGTIEQRYNNIVKFYEQQPLLVHRTSQSILFQQYSTPVPVCYLAGVYCGIDTGSIEVPVPEIERVPYPTIKSAKQVSVGQGYKMFKGLGGGKEYRVEFSDGYEFSTSRASDRADAIEMAKRHYYEQLDRNADAVKYYKKGGELDKLFEGKLPENVEQIKNILYADDFYDKEYIGAIAKSIINVDDILLKYTPLNPLVTSFNEHAYFHPHAEHIMREGIKVAFIKYAAHFVSSGNPRREDTSKIDAIKHIEEVLTTAKHRFIQKNDTDADSIIYLKEFTSKGNTSVILVAEINQYGQIRAVTHLPSQRLNQIKKKIDAGVWIPAAPINSFPLSNTGLSINITDRQQAYKGQSNSSGESKDTKKFNIGGILEEKIFFEPSAGNGNMTIAANPANFIVNEIDEIRNQNLKTVGFKEVLSLDASEPFPQFAKKFDAMLTNPPFGTMDTNISFQGMPIKKLEHAMALYGLQTIKDSGKAAIIIGGHTTWDNQGRIQAGQNRDFFVYLYRHYYVDDVINIAGNLYSRQGTTFGIRLILVKGRRPEVGGFPPLLDKNLDCCQANSGKVVSSFQDLLERVKQSLP